VVWNQNVVAHPGDSIPGRGGFDNRVGACAGGALHVGKFDDGEERASRRVERGGIVNLSCGQLGVSALASGEQQDRGQAEQQTSAAAAIENVSGAAENSGHGS
jgi:hypothetical protein